MPTLPMLNIKSQINDSPHVVILGAGASLAAFPNGDKNGKKLPLMANLVEIIGLQSLLNDYGKHAEIDDFEVFFDELSSNNANGELVAKIEQSIREYFAQLKLPNCPTIYDYLILSLRKKDIIATFNWDPFLVQAYLRNMTVTEPPRITFLHGNVAVGTCNEHRTVGHQGQRCITCGKVLEPSKLLYPVCKKDYQSDIYIKSEWNGLREYLEHAYYVTIFGYSAPVTDIEAKNLMLDIWVKNPTRELAQIEIIDIRSGEELKQTWSEFAVREHYHIVREFAQCSLYTHPRRSCDAFAMATLQCAPWKNNPWPRFPKLEDLHQWIAPLIAEEKTADFSGNPCPALSI